jgi:hypothetical protein
VSIPETQGVGMIGNVRDMMRVIEDRGGKEIVERDKKKGSFGSVGIVLCCTVYRVILYCILSRAIFLCSAVNKIDRPASSTQRLSLVFFLMHCLLLPLTIE